ncbi:hypothetical protein EAO68_22420 [Streptomyces sp. wa22]|nr:hypothetical protein EAO68_22420 [Streptomyces sp. wa22]
MLPAPAGMVPYEGADLTDEQRAPRARGDGPSSSLELKLSGSCSPRPRGWSRGRRSARHPRRVLPAPAGMLVTRRPAREASRRASRARREKPRLRLGP